MRLTGFEAIEFAEREGLLLHKTADRIDDGADNLSVAAAEAIADSDPELIWLEVSEDEYYGEPRNMESGGEPARNPRLAGQRPDELLPGQNSGGRSKNAGSAGTPGGEPEADLDRAMNWGGEDHAGDEQQLSEPQAGRAGGAVGGTPAGKRVRPR